MAFHLPQPNVETSHKQTLNLSQTHLSDDRGSNREYKFTVVLITEQGHQNTKDEDQNQQPDNR